MVKAIKQTALRMVFVLEIALFTVLYFFGAHGIQALVQLRHKNSAFEVTIADLEKEVDGLEVRLSEWDADPFYKEKVAREQLQMARKGDMVYYVR